MHEVLCGGGGGVRASHVLAPVIPDGDAKNLVDVSGVMVSDLKRGWFPS